MTQLASVGQVVAGLAARIDALVGELLPNARRDGHEWMVGSVAGEPGASMAINRGNKAGVWSDFSTGEVGDAWDLIAAVLFKGDKKEAFRWAKSWLGLDGEDYRRFAVTRQAVIEKAKRDEDALDDAQRQERAARLFRGARHQLRGTMAWSYLAGRGLDLAQLGRQPGALAFGDRVWCKEADGPLPAMLAAVQIGSRIVGVHRTYLAATGPFVGKARLLEPKKTLGPIRGGVIPLWRGGSKLGWSELWDCELDIDTVLDEAATHVTLTEGIENALSVAVAAPARRIAAAVSLANMASVQLPPCVRTVTIAADNDAEGSKAATQGLPRAIAALQGRGLQVRVARPPAGHKDFNDWLVALQGASAGASEEAAA